MQLGGLTTHIVGPADATTTCVLMHGFGAPGTDLVSLARALRAPVRFVFPEAPLELGGMYGAARAWWLLDLARIEADMRRGRPSDRSQEVPAGLAEARAQISELLDALEADAAGREHRLVIGGFSQGAMMAVDAAVHRPAPPAGLVLMSGTVIAEPVWAPRYASLRGVRVMQSHGTHDPLLPFAVAETLRDRLVAAGALVDWQPFAGGHEIPPPVLAAATQLLAAVAA